MTIPANDNEPLNARQIAELSKQFSNHMGGLLKDIELRKWAVTSALPHVNANNPEVLMRLAQDIYAFLVAGADVELKIK